MNQSNGKANGEPQGSSVDQQILQKKAKAFEDELLELQSKHGIVIQPILRTTPFGIVPDYIYQDKKVVDEANAKMSGNLAKAGQGN